MKIKLTEEQYRKLLLKEEEETIKEFNSCGLTPWINKSGEIFYFLNGCQTDDTKLGRVDKLKFNITQRNNENAANNIIDSLSFELTPHDIREINGKNLSIFLGKGFEYKENPKYPNQKVPSFTEEKLNDLLGREEISKFLSGVNGVDFRETYENIRNYRHFWDPTMDTNKGETRSMAIRSFSDKLHYNIEKGIHPTLTRDQIWRASKLFKELKELGYPIKNEPEPNEVNVNNKKQLINNTQESGNWGSGKNWFIKNLSPGLSTNLAALSGISRIGLWPFSVGSEVGYIPLQK